MTVAMANLKRVQEGGSGEIEVYAPICVAHTNEVREYEDKNNRPNADWVIAESPRRRRDTINTHGSS